MTVEIKSYCIECGGKILVGVAGREVLKINRSDPDLADKIRASISKAYELGYTDSSDQKDARRPIGANGLINHPDQ